MSYNIPKQYLELDSTSVLSAGVGVGLHLYNSDDGAGNYERLEINYDSNTAKIISAAAGTGTRRDIDIGGVTYFKNTASNWVKIDASGGGGGNSAAITTRGNIFYITAEDNFGNNNAFLQLTAENGVRLKHTTGSAVANIKLATSTTGIDLTGSINFNSEAILTSDAADTLAMRNGTNAQAFNVYNTYTDASNYERLEVKWDTNVAEIRAAAAGTGTVRDLKIFAGANGTSSAPTYTFEGDTDMGMYKGATTQLNFTAGGNYGINLGTGVMAVSSNIGIGWRSAQNLGQGTAYNTLLFRESTGVIGQYNSLFDAPQAFNIYNTWTDASNYERLEFKWDTNIAKIGTAAAGTGTLRALEFYVGASRIAQMSLSGTNFDRKIFPVSDGSLDIGTTSQRWRNTYTDSITIGDGVDAVLTSSADNQLELRNGTNDQEFRIYSSYTDASNNGGFRFYTAGNELQIRRFGNGTEPTSANIDFYYGTGLPKFTVSGELFCWANIKPTYDSSYTSGASANRWSNTYTDTITIGDGVDAILTADADNELALRNGTNAQKFSIYESYTDASNRSWLDIGYQNYGGRTGHWIASKASGTGTEHDLIIGDNSNKIWFRAPHGIINFIAGGSSRLEITQNGILPFDTIFPWTDGSQDIGTDAKRFANIFTDKIIIGDNLDAVLEADADNELALRNGTNGQSFHVYGTYTDASNYERLVLYHDGSNAVVGSEAAGTGSVAALRFATSGTNRFLVDSSGNLLPAAAQTYNFGSASQTFLGIFANSLTVGPYFSQSKIESDAANDLALRNGTNAQEFRIYNTYTNASNYERLEIKWDSNTASIRPTAAGTGTERNLTVQSGRLENEEGYSYIRVGVGTSAPIRSWRDLEPQLDSSFDLGNNTLRWATTYTDGIATDVETFTVTDTLDSKNHVCLCNATSGNITLNLPVASSTPVGTQYQIKKIDSSSNTVIITPNSGGGDLIDGSATYTLSNQWEGVIIVCDGGDWYVTGGVTNSGGGGGGGGGLGGGD